MFDFDAGKLIIIAIVALIVIGPKDLPRVLRQLGQAVGKMRRMASEFQGQFMEAMREADVADAKAEVEKLAKSAQLDAPFDPLADIRNELKGAIDKEAAAPALGGPVPIDLVSPDLASPDPSTRGLAAPELAAIAPAAAAGSLGVLGEAEPESSGPAGEPDAVPAPSSGEGVDAEMEALAEALKAEIAAPAATGAALRPNPESLAREPAQNDKA